MPTPVKLIVTVALIIVISSQVAICDDEVEKRYADFQVLRLRVSTNESLNALVDLYNEGTYDFWREPSMETTTDIMVAPGQLANISKIIDQYKINQEVMFQDLDTAIDVEKRLSVNRLGNKMNWRSYQRLDTIYDWMDTVVRENQGNQTLVLVSVETIGESYEKRPMRVLKISKNWSVINGFNRSSIWIDGGIHAREWISPATATYIAKEIIEATKRSEYWASSFDWYIAPVINPDGYEFSHTRDRLWRKTRSPPRPGNSFLDNIVNLCVGTDPNRNWDFKWGGMGGSINPCAPNYRGRSSSSEIEVKTIQNYILSKKDKLKLYITLHSYSQVILLPWAYSYTYSDDYDELLKVAQKAATRLESVRGTRYNCGATPYVLYPASGGSHDWAKGVAGIKYSYTVELPDKGFFGFLLPASRIIPTGRETLELVKSMAEDMSKLYYHH